MNKFPKGTRIILAVAAGALIVGGLVYLVYLSGKRESSLKLAEEGTVKGAGGASRSCQNIPELPDGEIKLATKIIDGDTFLIEGGYSLRVLGIDADERGYPCYEPAKGRLEELILNKEVRLEESAENLDQYCRYLRYVFLGDENISSKLVSEGLAIARFYPENIKYRQEIIQAEKEAKENKIGCKWSGAETRKEEETKTEFQWEELTAEKSGLDLIGACEAGKYLGRELIVEGKAADAYHDLKSNTVFLNFEKPYPDHCFTGVIFSSNLDKFIRNPEKYYLGKTVRIRGEVKEYKGKPEIILEAPWQIEIGK